MNFFHSITFRFTVWYLIVLASILILLSTGIYFNLSRSLYESLDRSLEVRATELNGIREIISIIGEGRFREELGEVVSLYFYNGDELIKVSARDEDVTQNESLLKQAFAGESSFTTVEVPDGQSIRLHAALLTVESRPFFPGGPRMLPINPDTHPAAIVIGRSTADIDEALARLLRTLVFAVPLTLIVAGGGGIFLARRALNPVEKIAGTAREIEESGDLSRRIGVETKDELGRLASTLNRMIERLERAFDRQREFTADASHELRTPLAIIEAESTLALQKERNAREYRSSLELVAQEAEYMSAIIDQLLALARADAEQEQLTFEEVDLGEFLGELASDVDILCREKGLDFTMGQMENLIVRGDGTRLKGLFLNLLDNAIRYTPGGGSVAVMLDRDGQTAVVTISDTGIGIPPEHITHIFERFYRVDKARSRADGGSGLGLAICRHIAESHGGRIEVESKVGEGSTFSVFLPIS